MRLLHASSRSGFAAAAAFVAAAVLSGPVSAQRLSLAERVTKLEQQAESSQGNIELVNQIQALQSQVQQLQGQVEELRHQVEQQGERNKQQYIDLDSRIGRIEGRGPGAGNGQPAAANNGQLDDIQLGGPNGDPPAPRVQDDAPLNPQTRPVPPVEPLPGTPPARAALDPAAEKAAYDDALNALKDGRYAESARRFQGFIDQYPRSELTANAYYWMGEAYYVTQNYRISLDTFQKLLKQYPDSQKAPDALLKLGYCQYELKQWDAAEATLNQVAKKYPDTTAARLAQGRLRALKLEGGRR